MKLRMCSQCKREPAEWAVQYIAEDKPTVTTLGSHYRGFQVLRLCEQCKTELLKAEGIKQEATP